MRETTTAFVHTSDVDVPLPDRSPVICTSRMKPLLLTVTGACHVAPLSVEKVTSRAPLPTLKSFQETYMFPK